MDDSIPSLSSGSVGSRFVSQNDIEDARKRREEQWKAAYARLGQEPPPQPVEDAYDGRSLAEKLAANKVTKQEEWEERNRLANQFRALEEDEVMFLDTVRERQEQEERARKEQDNEELKSFRQAVAARESAVNNKSPPVLTDMPTTTPATTKPANPAPTAKSTKTSLKGVLVKKKSKKAVAPAASGGPTKAEEAKKMDGTKKLRETTKRSSGSDAELAESKPLPKKQKVAES
ncbi:hypothetical protein NEOLEDRAFT_1053795 [Neolentinus lepideus HHB14362 ss-1]|uniref:FAM192A/Fyv6 N-terminal domain-containing protein n=1 Tax=Neolentinus lepideus HHB14362 ss-1 TaxID=1314782 RepID=A0A165W177_9AGAM|nr:hypothetical protein NEOLEDRAFT_1053795 [Neolentinus lepideus HHB14362 ss-1]